jgi:hypothetical protein
MDRTERAASGRPRVEPQQVEGPPDRDARPELAAKGHQQQRQQDQREPHPAEGDPRLQVVIVDVRLPPVRCLRAVKGIDLREHLRAAAEGREIGYNPAAVLIDVLPAAYLVVADRLEAFSQLLDAHMETFPARTKNERRVMLAARFRRPELQTMAIQAGSNASSASSPQRLDVMTGPTATNGRRNPIRPAGP